MWVELFNACAGAVQEFRLYQPDSALYFSLSLPPLSRWYNISWWWAWHAILGYLTPGTWRMEYRMDGVVLADHEFAIADVQPGPAIAPPRAQVRAGMGGGGAGKPIF